jgi:hypothetical protein
MRIAHLAQSRGIDEAHVTLEQASESIFRIASGVGTKQFQIVYHRICQ